MLSFISAKQAAEKWNISQRRVAILCSEKRINGAMFVGNMWIIPNDAEKPVDLRTVRYDEQKISELKPFIKWAGGKGQLLEQLEALFTCDNRTYTKYAEPMVGGGALLFRLLSKHKFEKVYISDTNVELINAYNVIKNNIDELVDLLIEMQTTYLPMDENGRKYHYYFARDRFNELVLNETTSVNKAALFLFLNKTCFNGLYRVNRQGKYNVPMGAYKNPIICDEENLRAISKALQNIEIVCGDYKMCESFVDENTFVYFDPPYRPLNDTSGFTAYTVESFDDNEQIKLAEFAKQLGKTGAKIVLSNSDPQNINPDDKFFEKLYNGFTINKVEASRAINSKSAGRGKISELLIHN